MIFIVLAAFLWGATNPLLKRFTEGFADDKKSGGGDGFLSDIWFLVQRPKYLITQLTNLSGTAVFFYALREADISVAAVATNALSLAITVVVSAMIGDTVLTKKSVLGILLVMIGLGLCTYDAESRKKA